MMTEANGVLYRGKVGKRAMIQAIYREERDAGRDLDVKRLFLVARRRMERHAPDIQSEVHEHDVRQAIAALPPSERLAPGKSSPAPGLTSPTASSAPIPTEGRLTEVFAALAQPATDPLVSDLLRAGKFLKECGGEDKAINLIRSVSLLKKELS